MSLSAYQLISSTAYRRLQILTRGSKILQGLIFAFLAGNLVIRFGTIFRYPPYNGVIAALLGGVILGCVVVVFFPRYLKYLFFLFGFSFFLFGFGSIDIQSRIFELVVTLVAVTVFVVNFRTERARGQASGVRDQESGGRGLNRPLLILLLCYVGLSFFSLLLLPVRQILRDFWFFGFPDFFFYLFIDPPYGFYYPVAAVIRLMLFAVLGLELAASATPHESYKYLFSGVFAGAVFCALIGLLDFYGVIPLQWFRFGRTATPGALHSTFGNRGWFGEFILISVPFVLIGFMSKIKGIWWRLLLFASLVLCEITLLLAGGRSGWVSYPVILFVCWLFFWFTKEGRLSSFHIKWKDLIKVAVSVPITIIISLVIVFYVFIPLSDQLKGSNKGQGIQQGGAATKARIVHTTEKLIEPSGRVKAWTQGIDVGRESPVFGLGYESFCWHATILSDMPNSYYTMYKDNKHPRVLQTPHNTFFSLFVSGGAVGLFLWLVVVGCALLILITDLITNKRLLNTPVIICIMSFHIFGIFQSMQYIPMIWSMIFLCLGYAMTIDEKTLPARLQRVSGVLTKTSVVLLGIGIFFYMSNVESRNLAQKYDMRIYAMEQDQDRFAGFYQDSRRWKYGDYRWCGKRGSILIAERGTRIGERGAGNAERQGLKAEDGGRNAEDLRVELAFNCRTPGLEEEPVVVTVSHEGEALDEILFEGRQSAVGSRQEKGKKRKGKKDEGVTVRRTYEVPIQPGEEGWLDIEVSRTWIPHNHLGNFDRRELGIGVKILNSKG